MQRRVQRNGKPQDDRRAFLKKLAAATGGIALAPAVISCGGNSPDPATAANAGPDAEQSGAGSEAAADSNAPPNAMPEDWDALAFNRDRGQAGAIPESYMAKITGPDGDNKHLGKHLPYAPSIEASAVPAGYAAIMFGDSSKGYAQHPASSSAQSTDHWFDWIRIRKATGDECQEVESAYNGWPEVETEDNGKYVAFEGDDMSDNGGKNTVYLAALPADVQSGDTIRVTGHCLNHGEYVEFVKLG